MSAVMAEYRDLLGDIKARVQRAQTRAALAANRQLIELYWDVGQLIHRRQQREGWGASVIPRLAIDLKSEISEVRGFSARNLRRMVQFYAAYPYANAIWPQPVAKLAATAPRGRVEADLPTAQAAPSGELSPQQPSPDDEVRAATLCVQLPWGHNVLLLQHLKHLPTRLWYMEQTLAQGWSRNVLTLMIKSGLHERQGAAISNFDTRLPAPQSDLAQQVLKDPYIFDFLTLDKPFRERELEAGLVQHVEKFLLELGVGFAFVGRQYKVTVGSDDFYIDLLFYHIKLRCFVVVELKVGSFKPEFAGKMNFYLNLVDDTLRHEHDGPTIGLILCQDKKQVLAEYALRGMAKPMGVSEYELTRALPTALKSALPTIAEIEAEMAEGGL